MSSEKKDTVWSVQILVSVTVVGAKLCLYKKKVSKKKRNETFFVNSRVHRGKKHAQWAARLYLGMAALINISVSRGFCMMSCQPQCSVTAASNPSPSLWSQTGMHHCTHPVLLSLSLPYSTSLAKGYHRGFQSRTELMALSSTLSQKQIQLQHH